MTLVERLTRVDADTLDYTYTVTDPETWTRPWTASIREAVGSCRVQYACHRRQLQCAEHPLRRSDHGKGRDS
jgi:hypothetical protein